MQRLRFRPPSWLRVLTTVAAVGQIVLLIRDPRPLAWIQVVIWTLLAAVWCLALDTVVDDDGIRTQGAWLYERISWADIARFAVDRTNGKPVLVLTSGKRKQLAYVPDSAWLEIQQRWQSARGIEADLG